MYSAPISGRQTMRPPPPRMRAASSESWSLGQSSSQPPCASSTARGQMPVKPLSTSISSSEAWRNCGAAAAERRFERQRHPARPGAVAARELGAADVVRAAAPQALDAAREVVLADSSVCASMRAMYAPRAAARPMLRPIGRAAPGVLEDAHARVVLAGSSRRISTVRSLRGAVDEDELDRAVEALCEHLRRGLADVLLLVEDGRQHADVDAASVPDRLLGVSARRTRRSRRG